MNPPFSYFGGKTGMARKLVDLMPPHRVYIETHAGSLAVLFAKKPVMHEIVNDRDDAVVNFFRVLRQQPDELGRLLDLTPHARAEYDAADLEADVSDVERARRFFVRVTQSFGKTAGRATGWSVTTARTQSIPGTLRGRTARFAQLAQRLSQVSIENCDAAALVDRLAAPDALVYADPPYVFSTRNSHSAGAKASDYRCEMTNDDHRKLAVSLRATPATVLLSGYACPLYDELYGDWHRTDFNVMLHSSNATTTDREGRVESVWCNKPLTPPPICVE